MRGAGGFGSSDKCINVATLKKLTGGDTIYTRDLFSKKEDDEPVLDTQTKLGMSLSDILRAAGVSKEEEDRPYEGDDQGPTPEWWKKMTKEEQKEYLDKELDAYQKELP